MSFCKDKFNLFGLNSPDAHRVFFFLWSLEFPFWVLICCQGTFEDYLLDNRDLKAVRLALKFTSLLEVKSSRCATGVSIQQLPNLLLGQSMDGISPCLLLPLRLQKY